MLKRLSTRAVTLLVALTALGACVDAKKRFDEFDDRVPVIDASTVDRPNIAVADFNGTWYVAVKALGNNLHLFATWTFTPGAAPSFTGVYQPLSTYQEEPAQRRSVGATLTTAAAMIDETASFVAPMIGTIDGMANPISGSPLGSVATLVGTVKNANLVCGIVTGHVCLGMPAPCEPPPGISIEPATFAAVRAADIAVVQAMALPPLDRCPAAAQ